MTTQKHLCLQRSLPGKQEKQQPSPAQMQEMYAAFNAWKEKFKANILDMGGRLEPGGKFLGEAGVTDGPFVEAKELIGGFMIIAAESYDHALEVAGACPGLISPGSGVEVREISGP